MTGSEKQIAWAEKIIAENKTWYDNIMKYADEYLSARENDPENDDMDREINEKRRVDMARAAEAFEMFFGMDDASMIIDSRPSGKSGDALLGFVRRMRNELDANSISNVLWMVND